MQCQKKTEWNLHIFLSNLSLKGILGLNEISLHFEMYIESVLENVNFFNKKYPELVFF